MSTIKRFGTAPTQFQKVGDIRIAYREIGAVLGNFDSRIVGSLATISTGEPS